ncbi:MAG: hypothetical protein LBJ15_11220 [Comamonas sp.]|jgi:protein-arginine kinase activator protein McsA|uniref:hypothetical protein n=1 Tax=Comamonas sp. TaxID=34028 RepID=UPI00281F0985|nr:hypothetical protein [Comamonas sp.]MDR0214561.1 hypothetical protein [Comamonas sp.]
MSTAALKHCYECREDWPADTEFFHRESRNTDGLAHLCKACRKQAATTYKPKNHITDSLQSLLTGLLHQGARA